MQNRKVTEYPIVGTINQEEAREMRQFILASLLIVSVATITGCGDGSSSNSGSSSGTGHTYWAAKYTNGYATATNGPFSTLTACQEFLASPDGRMPSWVGASCIESSTRP